MFSLFIKNLITSFEPVEVSSLFVFSLLLRRSHTEVICHVKATWYHSWSSHLGTVVQTTGLYKQNIQELSYSSETKWGISPCQAAFFHFSLIIQISKASYQNMKKNKSNMVHRCCYSARRSFASIFCKEYWGDLCGGYKLLLCKGFYGFEIYFHLNGKKKMYLLRKKK